MAPESLAGESTRSRRMRLAWRREMGKALLPRGRDTAAARRHRRTRATTAAQARPLAAGRSAPAGGGRARVERGRLLGDSAPFLHPLGELIERLRLYAIGLGAA